MLWEISSDSEEMSTSHSRLPWFITQIVFMIGASSSCRRKHRLADYKSALAWLQRCRSLWMYFFLLFLQHHSCLTPQTDIFRSFHMAVSRFKAFCLRALQTFAVSDHIRWFEVWSYCSPPPVCHCENVPLSRLLEVILGNSFQCRKYLTEVQVAGWKGGLPHFRWRLPPAVRNVTGWVSGWCLTLTIRRLQRWWEFLHDWWGFSSKCVFLYGCTTGTSSHADSAMIWSVLEVADSSLWVKAEALNLRSNLESVSS